ncbi:hypothetical protein BRADI_4g27622v3 [Brachypodium distachyon]|uniref:Uncharacterized protein n=1 Tax=Brachypodium distachyon TaxID=15368 RepID=A0A0Q3PK51_BRADI|nr:hypothetical protein BRADI_4g27622v3 [Brachypodium distachyon]
MTTDSLKWLNPVFDDNGDLVFCKWLAQQLVMWVTLSASKFSAFTALSSQFTINVIHSLRAFSFYPGSGQTFEDVHGD